MIVELELWHLISLLLAFFGCVAAFGKVLLSQIDRRLEQRFNSQQELLNERFATQERLRADTQARWDRDFEDLEKQLRATAERLPNEYVRREDWIRFSATMDAKVDALHRKLDGLLEKVYARG